MLSTSFEGRSRGTTSPMEFRLRLAAPFATNRVLLLGFEIVMSSAHARHLRRSDLPPAVVRFFGRHFSPGREYASVLSRFSLLVPSASQELPRVTSARRSSDSRQYLKISDFTVGGTSTSRPLSFRLILRATTRHPCRREPTRRGISLSEASHLESFLFDEISRRRSE